MASEVAVLASEASGRHLVRLLRKMKRATACFQCTVLPGTRCNIPDCRPCLMKFLSILSRSKDLFVCRAYDILKRIIFKYSEGVEKVLASSHILCTLCDVDVSFVNNCSQCKIHHWSHLKSPNLQLYSKNKTFVHQRNYALFRIFDPLIKVNL